MNIEYIKEYKEIRLKAESLRMHAEYLSKCQYLSDYCSNLLAQAEVCDAQCLAADACIQHLPEPKRTIIKMLFCKGLKPAAVASELNMDSRQVQRQGSIAINMLKQM